MAECAAPGDDSEHRNSQRLKYDRKFLLKLKWCKAARTRPSYLPRYPEVIIDEPNFSDAEAEVSQEDDLYEYTNNYKWIPREMPRQTAVTKRKEKSTSPVETTRETSKDRLDANTLSLGFLKLTEGKGGDRHGEVKQRERSTSPMKTTIREMPVDKLAENRLRFLKLTEKGAERFADVKQEERSTSPMKIMTRETPDHKLCTNILQSLQLIEKNVDRFSEVKEEKRSTSPMKPTARDMPDDELDRNSLQFLQQSEVSTSDFDFYPEKEIAMHKDANKLLTVNDDRNESQQKKTSHVSFPEDKDCIEELFETIYDRNVNETNRMHDNYSPKPQSEQKGNVIIDKINALEEIPDLHFAMMETKCVEGVKTEGQSGETQDREQANRDLMKTQTHEPTMEMKHEANKNTSKNQTKAKGRKNLHKTTETKILDKFMTMEYNQEIYSRDSQKPKLIDDDIIGIRHTENSKLKETDKSSEDKSFQENYGEGFKKENATTIHLEPVQSTEELIDDTEIFCEPCEESNEKERAVCYCIECNDFLCEVCSKVHKKSKLSRYHQLLGKDEMPNEKVIKVPDDGACVQHVGELMRFYCQNHGQIVCPVCVTLSHKNCTVDYIIHAAKIFYENQEYRNLLKKLQDLTVTSQKQKSRSAANADTMNDECARLVLEIETFRSSFDRLLDSLEIAAKTKAREICQKGSNELKTTVKICSKIEDEIKDMNSTLQKLGQFQMKQPLFIAAKRADEKIKEIENTVSGLSELSKLKKIRFVPKRELIDILHTFESIGKIEILSDENVNTADSIQGYAGQTGSLEEQIQGKSTIEKVALIGIVGVKAQRDLENCWITGCVGIDNEILAVVDRKNSCIKLVSVKNNLITAYFKLFIPPWDITYTEDRELVVTCEQIILFIDLPSMKSTKELKVGGCSYGIDYYQGNLFVTFGQPTPMLQILKTNGDVSKVIPMINAGLPVVSRPIYISAAHDGKMVAVADNLQIAYINTEAIGNTVGLSLKSLGITFGFNTEILFIEESSGSICLWRPDKDKEARVISQREWPQSLAFCRKTSLLYVSHYGSKSNLLSVFKVS